MSVYACSDIHGIWELWNGIKNFLKPEDTLYYLGDCMDRGDSGWTILKEMLNDPRIIYIAGNHDIMLADRIGRPYDYEIANIHHSNGGGPTWMNAEEDPEANEIKIKIRQMPLYATYTNQYGEVIFMSHSGSINIDEPEDLIWDRSEYISRYRPTGYDVVIHGHTTIPHLIKDLKEINEFFKNEPEKQWNIPEWDGGAYWYTPYRCDIDCCSIVTNRTVLIDLNTYDQHIITF